MFGRNQSGSLNLVHWMIAFVFFIGMFAFCEYLDSHKTNDTCGMEKCRPYSEYMKILGQKQSEWQKLNLKSAEYFELGRQIQTCRNQIDNLANSPIENPQQTNIQEIHIVQSSILECKNAVEKSLQKLKKAVEK